MKYLIAFLIFLALPVLATQWNNYPTTNTMGSSDTLMIGNGGTNATITAGNFSSTQIQPPINTASNSVLGNAQTAINTTSNSLNGTINTSSNNIVVALPPRTNYVAITNSPGTAGKALVIVGTDAFGSVLTKETNWPSGSASQTPWTSDIDGAQYALTNLNRLALTNVTGQFQIYSNASLLASNGLTTTYVRISTNQTLHLGSNAVDTIVMKGIDGSITASNAAFSGGNSNWLNGFTRLEMGPWLILSNAAPSDAVNAKTWFVVTNNAGGKYLIPGYQ